MCSAGSGSVEEAVHDRRPRGAAAAGYLCHCLLDCSRAARSRPTDWNRSLANTLKKLLKRFEEDASGGAPLTKEEHEAQLDRIAATFHLVGFPIHTAMADSASLQPLVAKLRHTNLYKSESPKIQFALSAYVQPMVNNICSVWVYVAALHDVRAAATAP